MKGKLGRTVTEKAGVTSGKSEETERRLFGLDVAEYEQLLRYFPFLHFFYVRNSFFFFCFGGSLSPCFVLGEGFVHYFTMNRDAFWTSRLQWGTGTGNC